MTVKIRIRPGLLQYTGGQEIIEVTGHNVGECISHLIERHPDIREGLLDNDGKVLGYVDIFVNGKSSFPAELRKPVGDGDEIDIVRLLAGG